MRSMARATNTNYRIVFGGSAGDVIGPTRYYQQGMGHRFPGVPLDVLKDTDIVLVPEGGDVAVMVCDDACTRHVIRDGQAFRLSASTHRHRI